jgi:hypothetical protein
MGLVTKPLPVYPRTKIITSEEEGQEVAHLLGHGAVTASPSGVEGAAGPDYPSIPLHLAEEVARARPEAELHIKARLADVPGGRVTGGIRPYFREVVAADM